MSTTITYPCPNCGAGLSFDADKQKFACEFCLSEFTEEEISSSGASEEAERHRKMDEDYCSSMNAYICASCGAEVVADENTAADFCAFCHTPVVLSGKLSGQMRPHKIIPFQYDKKAAEEFPGVKHLAFGPFEAPVYRVDNKYRMRMIVKCVLNRESRALFAALLSSYQSSSPIKPTLSIDFNPSAL